MEHLPATNPPRSWLVRVWPWLVVLAVLLLVGFIRVRLLEMPLERDEGEYAYAGQLLLQGIPPYELAYNMKLPGTYFVYALGMALFGQTTAGVHLTLLLANTLTIVFVFLLGRKLFGITAGLAACASYGLMSTSTAVLGMAAHATQFVVLFAVPGTLLLWQALQTKNRRTLFFSGLLYGLAFLMKQQGMCFAAFGFFVLLWSERRVLLKGPAPMQRIGCYVAGAALPFMAVCIYLAGAGVFAQFWFWTFSYARAYATSISLGEGWGYLKDYIYNQFAFFGGFWILAGAGLLVALRSSTQRARLAFALGFLFFSIVGVLPGFYFREHYFVLLLPAFALVVGLAVEFLRSASKRWTKIIPVILLAGVLVWGIWLQRWALFQMPPSVLSQTIYRANPLAESKTVGDYLREHSSKDARVAVIGSEPQIYFYAGRHSATGFLYTYPLMENQPYAVVMQRQMIREIESARPEYIVLVLNRYSWLFKESSNMEILGWAQKYLAEHYQCIGIVDDSPGKPRVNLWGEAANHFNDPLEQFLKVYQRKPGSN